MTCCGKAIRTPPLRGAGRKAIADSILKGKNIATDYINLARGKKYEFTDGRVRICQTCDKNYWIGRALFCLFRLRRFGKTLWADPQAYVPGFARKEEEECYLGRWNH